MQNFSRPLVSTRLRPTGDADQHLLCVLVIASGFPLGTFPLRVECRKLSQKFVGPFKIARRVNPVTYCLTLPCSIKVNPTFHVSLLNPVLCSPFVAPGKAPPPPRVIGGRPAFTVHRILGVREVRGSRQYLVDWEGYGPEERSWVPARNILDPELIREFRAQEGGRTAGNVRRRS